MPTLSDWAYTQPLTFWANSVDDHGQPTYTLRFVAKGTYQVGGETQSGDDGVQFVPASTYWIGREPAEERPQRGWKVYPGIHTGQPPEGAEIVRKAGCDDDSMHGFSGVDWTMWT